jgi:transposase-like protein
VILAQFKKLLVALEHLTDKQAKDVEKFLKGDSLIQPIITELKQRMIDEPECPHCLSSLITRHGKAGAMQRNRCKNCTKTFNALTKTPLARLQYKEKWLDYLQCMINGKVLRASATDCDSNHLDGDTAFFNCLQPSRQLYLKVLLRPIRPYLHAHKREVVHLSESQEKEE